MSISLAESPLAPDYDRSAMSTGIVHIGVGGFHRAHEAACLDSLMRRRAGSAAPEDACLDWGICGIGMLPGDTRMRDALAGQDHLYTLIRKHPGGLRDPAVIGSIHDYLFAPDDPEAVLSLLSAPATRIVSLTITEGGYNVDDTTGEFHTFSPGAVHDAEHPGAPTTAFGYIVEALRRRREAGTVPFTVLSCDNLPGNGKVARTAVVSQAAMSDPELADWIDGNVAFPSCMVDRITPQTTQTDIAELRRGLGVEDSWPVVCEPFSQWVLEDDFPAGRPPLEEIGVQMVDDVAPYELMKLRLLNASHQALGHLGLLAGHTMVHEAMQDKDLAGFVGSYMRHEALPTLGPVPGIDPEAYCRSLEERLAGKAVRDTLARQVVDASDRLATFLVPVIRDRLAAGDGIGHSALILAGWYQRLDAFEQSGADVLDLPDPLRDRLLAAVREERTRPGAFLETPEVFGDLASSPELRAAFLRARDRLCAQGLRPTLLTATVKP